MLTDNGMQFTDRFIKPVPSEVLFERICREHGIATRHTKPRSPTTTGKIERFHKTLRAELLDETVPFADIATAQQVIDTWVRAYNQQRPHQSLKMRTPATVFAAAPPPAPLDLQLPASSEAFAASSTPEPVASTARRAVQEHEGDIGAVEWRTSSLRTASCSFREASRS